MAIRFAWTPKVWLELFEELLNDDELNYGDEWTLNFNYTQTVEINTEQRERGWKVNPQKAFANFQCGSCHKTWTSAQVTLLFRYRLQRNRGTVIMRPFGQVCRRCQDDKFHLPGFLRKEMEQPLLKLFCKIRKNCYGESEHDGGSPPPTKNSKPHEKSLCEACHLGICHVNLDEKRLSPISLTFRSGDRWADQKGRKRAPHKPLGKTIDYAMLVDPDIFNLQCSH